MDARRKWVKEIVVETLQEVCDFDIGKKVPDSERPFSDLGLESADGILVAPRLAGKLGITIANKINPLIDDSRDPKNCERTVGEIVDYMLSMMPSEEKKYAKK